MQLPASHQNHRPSGLLLASLARRLLPNCMDNIPRLQCLLEGEFLACRLLQREEEPSDDLAHDQRLVTHPAALLPRAAEPHRL